MRNLSAMAGRLPGYRRYALGGGIMALAVFVLALSLLLPLLHHLDDCGLEAEECPISAIVSALSLAVPVVLGLVLLTPARRAPPLPRPKAVQPCAVPLTTQSSRAPPRS